MSFHKWTLWHKGKSRRCDRCGLVAGRGESIHKYADSHTPAYQICERCIVAFWRKQVDYYRRLREEEQSECYTA